MYCYICVTYMVILCSARPPKTLELSALHERSLFRDVIESLRMRSELPEDINQYEENNLAQNYDRYGYDNEQSHLPSDVEFIPRRNDRIEMPTLKYRFPKNLNFNATKESEDKTKDANPEKVKEEVVIFVTTPKETSTEKPKKKNSPKPHKNRIQIKQKENEEVHDTETEYPENPVPITNTMAGLSQIGNRESQMVVKPTVIVNFRGTVSHKDSDIRLEGRKDEAKEPQNIFNINQEIMVERSDAVRNKPPNKIKQGIKVSSANFQKMEDKITCRTDDGNKTDRENRKNDSVFEILFTNI